MGDESTLRDKGSTLRLTWIAKNEAAKKLVDSIPTVPLEKQCLCDNANVQMLDTPMFLHEMASVKADDPDGIPLITLVCGTCGRLQFVSGYEAYPPAAKEKDGRFEHNQGAHAKIVRPEADGVPPGCRAEQVKCSCCGKPVSNTVYLRGTDLIIRAFVECPECIDNKSVEKAAKRATEHEYGVTLECEECGKEVRIVPGEGDLPPHPDQTGKPVRCLCDSCKEPETTTKIIVCDKCGRDFVALPGVVLCEDCKR